MKAPGKAQVCLPYRGGRPRAAIGDNRKMIVFKIGELPEMTRGKGVRLQKFKDGGLSDARAFRLKDGLPRVDSSGRT